jgi:hypothetical protein
MKIENPKNQHSLVIWLLLTHYTTGVTMVDCMKVFFHKFGTRLLELEVMRGKKLKITRLPITKRNRFGHQCTFLRYKSNANPVYLSNLLKKLNKNGFYQKKG